MGKKVLMAVANYYTSPFQVGSHHYARAFEKLGYEVLFISNPISPIHKLFANTDELKERERICKSNGEKAGSILYYVPNALFTPQNKPFLSSKFVIDNWYKFTTPNILDYALKNGFEDVDILWFDSPMFGFLLDNIKYKKSILRIADYSKGFSAVSQNQFEKEVEIANRADRVIYSAKNLKDKYTEIKDKTKMQYVPNGIDLDFFEKADKSLPDEFKDIPEPRVIYIGAIHEWFDVELVYYCAKTLPTHSFIIIGPEQKDLAKLRTLDNIYLLGAKPYSRVPQFLSHSQVGIIPFDVKNYPELINSVNPLKMYEYLACGLHVVSTKWEQIEDMENYVCLANNPDKFLFSLTDSCCEKFNLKENSWHKKLLRIVNDL